MGKFVCDSHEKDHWDPGNAVVVRSRMKGPYSPPPPGQHEVFCQKLKATIYTGTKDECEEMLRNLKKD